jgi:demethylmenaquinone methyltransferase/2-methoxy-6-polyprenyl-1,4-benzoquinol methylase
MRAAGARVWGLDLAPRMLQHARRRDGSASGPPCAWIEGDMTALPIASASVDVVTTGYGLRNVPDLDAALSEIARVLAPRGRFLSLDFNRPQVSAIRHLYLGYLEIVGATLGWVLHGDPDTYRYIPASIRRYPGARGVSVRLARAGFVEVRETPILLGLLTIHQALLPLEPAKPAPARVRKK